MAKKKSKKIKMIESHEAQTIGFLQRSGVPAGDMKKLINEIHELVEFGGVSIPEAHQEALENWHQRTAFAALKDLEKEHKKQAADVAKAAKRAIAAAKAVTKANEAAARAAAKAAAKAPVVTVPAAEPAGPTVMPPRRVEPPRQESGIRKALGKSLTKEEQEYQKTLDKLRLDAEKTVQDNEELFGTRNDQTIDQSTAYELYDGVVRLGESAAKARKAEDKQRLLASLNAYKKIVMNLTKEGNDKEKELANKLLDVIASIEKKLSKGSGEIGRLKENLQDWAQRLPENLAAKIPLVGGFLSGMIQRKRERKEGEEYEKQDILAAASRGTGGTSLFGTYGGRRGGMGGMSESAIEGISTGGTDLGGVDDSMETGTITKPERSTGLGGGETIQTLQSILIQVSDIKSLIQGQTNTEAGTDAVETEREAADREYDFLNKLKGLFGGGKGGKAGAALEAAGGLGWKELIGSLIGKEVLMAAIAPVLGVLNSILGTIVSWPVIGGALVVALTAGGTLAITKAITDVITGLKMYLDQYINKATGKVDPNPRGFMGAPRIPQADIDATQSMKPDGTYTTSGSLPTNATSISESIDNEQLLKMIDEDAAASPKNSPNFVGPPSPSTPAVSTGAATPAVSTGAATPAAMIAGAVMGGMNTVIPAASNSVMSATNIAPAVSTGAATPAAIGNIIPPTPAKKEYKNPVELMEGWKNPIELTPQDLEEHARLSEERKKVWKNPKFSTPEEKAQLAAADEKLNNSKFSLSSAAQNTELEKRMEDQNSKNNEIDSQKRLSETTSKGTTEPTATSEKSAINNIAGEEVIDVAAATGAVGTIIKNEKYNDEDWVAGTGADGKPIEGMFINKKTKKINTMLYSMLENYNSGIINKAGDTTEKGRQIGIAKMQSEGWSESEIAEAYPSPATGTISAPSTSNTAVGAATAQLDKSRGGLEDEQASASAGGASNNSNTVIAPKTTNTTINNNVGGNGTRNNDPTLKSAERGSM